LRSNDDRAGQCGRDRLASLLWRLPGATTIETGLFEIQANHLSEFRQARSVLPASREVVYAMFGRANSISYDHDPAAHDVTMQKEALPRSEPIPSDLLSILPPSSRVAFYVLPICPTSRSTA
jgi:hypothetical protein